MTNQITNSLPTDTVNFSTSKTRLEIEQLQNHEDPGNIYC